MSPDERLHIIPVPSLVATLLRREQEKGAALTEAEVLEIRDNCPSVAMTDEMLARVVERRGYDDIDPENAWEEWQAIRPSLISGDANTI
jgi:hypothetical protein